MDIFIKTMTNKYKFSVNLEDTILHLKYQIQDTLHIDVRQQRLIFRGYPMVDENTLQKSGAEENSVIHLILCMI